MCLSVSGLSFGTSIRGQFVGTYDDANGRRHAFLQLPDGSAPIVIDYPGAVATIAMGINPAGAIVGQIRIPPAALTASSRCRPTLDERRPPDAAFSPRGRFATETKVRRALPPISFRRKRRCPVTAPIIRPAQNVPLTFDPRYGTVEYRLSNISRDEPPAELFVIPSDYSTGGTNAEGRADYAGTGAATPDSVRCTTW